jgi:hypothetical protein
VTLFSPNLMAQDFPDSDRGDAVLFGEFGMACASGCVADPNSLNLFARQFGAGVFFAGLSAPLAVHVTHVFKLRRRKQMVRTNAPGIVASVTHKHPVRDRSVRPFIRDAVGVKHSAVHSKPAVSRGVHSPSPHPACIGLVDLCPEAVLCGRTIFRTAMLNLTRHAAGVYRTLFDAIRGNMKGFTALLTDALNLGTLGVHIDLRSMCRAPGGCNRAGAFAYPNYTKYRIAKPQSGIRFGPTMASVLPALQGQGPS